MARRNANQNEASDDIETSLHTSTESSTKSLANSSSVNHHLSATENYVAFNSYTCQSHPSISDTCYQITANVRVTADTHQCPSTLSIENTRLDDTRADTDSLSAASDFFSVDVLQHPESSCPTCQPSTNTCCDPANASACIHTIASTCLVCQPDECLASTSLSNNILECLSNHKDKNNDDSAAQQKLQQSSDRKSTDCIYVFERHRAGCCNCRRISKFGSTRQQLEASDQLTKTTSNKARTSNNANTSNNASTSKNSSTSNNASASDNASASSNASTSNNARTSNNSMVQVYKSRSLCDLHQYCRHEKTREKSRLTKSYTQLSNVRILKFSKPK